MGNRTRRRRGQSESAGSPQPVRDIRKGTQVRFETVLNNVYRERKNHTIHVAAAGLVQSEMSAHDAWEQDLITKKRSGTVLEILIPAKTPMVDLKTGEQFSGLPLPVVVYKHKSRVSVID